MSHKNLSTVIIPNSDLETWVRSFDTSHRRDRGLEFLTLEGTLPPGVKEVNIKPELKKYLKYKLKKEWKPWSIRAMDQLREPAPSSIYYFDFLNPKSYKGKKLKINGIPYSSPFLKAMAYLTASIIAGGFISRRRSQIIPPKKRKLVYQKLRPCTTIVEEESERYTLKAGYTNVLRLVGLPNEKVMELDYEKLGLDYLEKLLKWMNNGKLSDNDYTHGLQVMSKFVEGIIDHKRNLHSTGTSEIHLPAFKKKSTAKKFNIFVENALKLTYPHVEFTITPPLEDAKRKNKKGGFHYRQTLTIPKKYKIKNSIKGITITYIG